ncbi:MAG: methyltransferase domain-containing protein [Clostridiales bacterium]|nr:methyltransferase domain-containing protein [Clostridiales bacterium]
MNNNDNDRKNANRFTGFGDIYDRARPSVPDYPIKIILQYLQKKPCIVVDLGCGTGLSSIPWKNKCDKFIGIDPSEDMLAFAKPKESSAVKFQCGFGNDTGLPDLCADAVVCSQSFHWMEPKSTLKEINRILSPCGVFAAIDCDWPPISVWQAEKAYSDIYEYIKRLERETPEIRKSFVRYDKNNHLKNMSDSGYFRYCREITFSNTEKCTASRFTELLLSQGSTQKLIKNYPEKINEKLNAFQEKIGKIFGDNEFDIDFSYRMRIAVK